MRNSLYNRKLPQNAYKDKAINNIELSEKKKGGI